MAFLDETGLAELWRCIGDKHDKDKNYIGDIKSSLRTDMGDTWLLCNGASVSAHDYSELAKLFPTLADTWVEKDLWSGSGVYRGSRIYCVTYANGYWVAGGQYYNGSTYYARIAYTTNIAGTWTTKDLWSGGKTSPSSVRCIAYANGRWVAGGDRYQNAESGSYLAQIGYTTDITGAWTVKDLWRGNGGDKISCITYADGHWAVGGQRYDGSCIAQIAYTTDPAGAWTAIELWRGSNDQTASCINCITYDDGRWVVGGHQNSGTFYAKIAYATSLAGGWAIKDLWSRRGGSSAACVYCVAYANGQWVAGGEYYDGSVYYARIAYTTDLAGTWTIKDLWSGNSEIRCVTYEDGKWVLGGTYSNTVARIAYATNLAGPWTIKDLWSNCYTEGLQCIAFINRYWIAGGHQQSGNTETFFAKIAYRDATTFNLPTISTNGAYTYIKAKED